MREFYQLINEYPWTTFFLMLFVVVVVAIIRDGDGK
mgnify:CR=1 FL=1